MKVYRNYILGSLIFGLLLCLGGCATNGGNVSTSGKFRNTSARTLLIQGEKALAKYQYKNAIERFEALDTLYPFGRYTRQAQLNVIYAYYLKDEKGEVLATADRYIKLYPRGPDTDYAYYMKGIANMSLKMPLVKEFFGIDPAQRQLTGLRHAFRSFDRLIAYFPNSRYAPEARRKMIYIRNLLAQHELEVAAFYYRRRAYVGAANRAADVVRYFQGAPQVVPALKLMVKAYRAMGEDHLADDTLRVLHTNYSS